MEVDLYDPLVPASDEDVVAAFRAGQREAFGVLLRRYERELYGYLRRYLGDASLADDVFQNTFLQIFIKSEQFEEGRPVRPWLYAIATNQAIDAMRKIGRHATVSLDRQTGQTQQRPQTQQNRPQTQQRSYNPSHGMERDYSARQRGASRAGSYRGGGGRRR